MREKIIYVMMFLFLTSVYHADVYAKKDPAVKYTKIGAEAEGNKSGEITAFEGNTGLVAPPKTEKGMYLPNPYKDEKMLFRIDYKNVDKYADKINPGQVARLKKNKKSYMDIYPTHRNVVFPEYFYTATEKNISTCRLDSSNKLVGWNGGLPFPYPDNVHQMVWNIKRQYFADDTVGADEARRVVSPSGRIKKELWTTEVMYFDGRLTSKVPNPEGVACKIRAEYTYPASIAGTSMMTIYYADDSREDDAWIYLPTLRRVRRAPALTKGGQIDGESTMDEIGFGFRGPINDYDWKFLGKKEIYAPMNCYDMNVLNAKDEDECLPGDINSANTRWELRRMWVVEGTMKPGVTHPYSRRIEYMDEDTWQHTIGDRYDRRGNLWRLVIFYSYYDYYQKQRAVPRHIYMNLESGRYEVRGGCRVKESRIGVSNIGKTPEEFSVQNLRRAGR